MNYEFVEHTADLSIKAEGSSLEELFINFAEGYKEAAYDAAEGADEETEELSFTENSAEELLVSFLSELNYFNLVKKLLFISVESIDIYNVNNKYKMSAGVNFKQYDEKNDELKEEIKSVTFHNLEIEKKDDKYTATIVFDI